MKKKLAYLLLALITCSGLLAPTGFADEEWPRPTNDDDNLEIEQETLT